MRQKAQRTLDPKAPRPRGRPKGSTQALLSTRLPDPQDPLGDHAHARLQKLKNERWSLENRRRWWLVDPLHEPLPPHPRDKVPEKDLPQAKIQAVEAMHEFGVLVEASRASGMGRYQLEYLYRNPTVGNGGGSRTCVDPDFRADLIKAKRECQERLEGAFIQRGRQRGGDLAGIFYLKHNRERYREIQRVELTGKDGSPLQALDAAKAELLLRLGKLAGSVESGGFVEGRGPERRKGLEGREEIVLSGDADETRPRLVKADRKSKAS